MENNSPLGNFPDILKVLWLYVAGIISVLTMYFLLTGIDQGIDVVIQAGEQVSSGILSVIAVSLWAYLMWYSCRLLSYTKQTRAADISTKLLQLLPRLLAFNCFICVQVSIFSLPTFGGFSFWQILLFVVAQNLYYIVLHHWFTHNKMWAKILGWVVMVAAIGVYSYMAWHNFAKCETYERHKFWLPILGALMFVMQALMLLRFVRRRQKIDEKNTAALAHHEHDEHHHGVAKYINSTYATVEKRHIKIFSGVAFIAIAIYCFAVFSIRVADKMGPMAFVMLALSVLVGFSNLVSFFSIRFRVNLFLFIFIIAAFVGKFGDPYKVRMVDPVGKNFYEGRPAIRAYLYKWMKKRESILQKYMAANKTFPIYVVLSDGGASRAGNWVCSVLSSLQDSSAVRDSNDLFSDHLLAIAGASGGSVGNAAFYSMLRSRQEGILNGQLSSHSARFFDADFLTFTLARLAGPDFFRHLIPIRSIMDRGAALETVLATGSEDPIIDTQLSRPLSAAFDTSGALPIFFITTTRVQDGMPCILSSTQLPTHSQRQDVTALLDSENTDIRFATAAIMSSRFPYVSPAGNIHNNYFVDGGYVDNAGSGIMLDFLEELEEMARQYSSDTTNDTAKMFNHIVGHVKMHVIHIYNSPEGEQVFSRINPLANDMVTPVLTLAGMQGSSTLIYTATLKQYFEAFNSDTLNAVIDYSLYDPKYFAGGSRRDTMEEPYPMSWVISTYQLERMHRRLDSANLHNADKFWFLGKK